MPEKKYSQRIPESRWQFHKPTIYRLYAVQNKPLTAPGGVRDIMLTKYGFSATKAQYETRLRKWGFYKYTSTRDRHAQASISDTRMAEGQEAGQHNGDPDDEPSTETSSLPRKIPIRTLSSCHPAPLSAPPVFPSLALTEGSKDNLSVFTPSVMFQSPVPGRESEPIFFQDRTWTSNANLDATDPSDSVWQAFINEDSSPTTSKGVHESSLPGIPGSVVLSPSEMNAGDLIGRKDIGSSTSNSFPIGFPQSTTTTRLGSFSIPDFATSVMPVISSILPKAGSYSPIMVLGDSSTFKSVMRNMIPPNTMQLIGQQNIDRQTIYMIFHRLVNTSDAVGALDWPETNLDRLFKIGITHFFSLGGNSLSKVINSIPSPYNLALIQNMFCAALILGDAPVLNAIMDRDRENLANRPVFLAGLKYYPLEYGILRGYTQVTEVLLDHGADPNWQKHPDFLSKTGWMRTPQHGNSVQIMQLLIDYGLEVDPPSAMLQMKDCDRDELLALVTHCLDKSFETFFHQRALPRVLLRPDWDDSFSETLKEILVRASSDRHDHRDLWNSVLSESLSSAVLRSHTPAVKILLAMGAVPDVSCLISAVQSNDLETLDGCLNRGLNPNIQVPKSSFEKEHDYERDRDCTGLSESIRNRCKGAFQVLQARGFISDLAHQPAGFVPALVAACEIGDSALVDQLLTLQNLPQRQEKIEKAIEAAVEGNKHYIIKRLLSVEIEPTTWCLILAIRNKDLAVLQLLAKYVDSSDMPRIERGGFKERSHTQAIIFEALQWGDQTAIEYVLRLGYPVNVQIRLRYQEYQDWNLDPKLQPPDHANDWHLTPLSAAVLKGDTVAVMALMAYGAQVTLQNSHLTSYQFQLRLRYEGYRDGWLLTPLAAGAVRNDLPLIKELLRIGADPFDNSALFVCAAIGLEDIVEMLLSAFRGRYPDGAQSFASDALCRTMEHCNQRLLRLLARDTDLIGRVMGDRRPGWYIPSLPSFDTEFTSPLGEAIRLHSVPDGAHPALDVLIPLVKDFDAVIHRSRKHGNMTSLLYAIELHSLETVRKLHRAGANISQPAIWNIPRTPLQAAAQSGDNEILNYLLEEGVNSNEPPAPRAGATALQLAAMIGNVGIATILLEAGADINTQPAPCDGRTAFEGATEHGRLDMMIFLVHHGADLLSDDNKQYQRAIQFAEDNLQHAAKEFANDLYEKAFADHEASFINSCENNWADIDMTDIEQFFSYVE